MAKAKKPKQPKYLVDGVQRGRYVRVWRENREWVIQIWVGKTPDGDPIADWEMPGILDMESAIDQAFRQTTFSLLPR